MEYKEPELSGLDWEIIASTSDDSVGCGCCCCGDGGGGGGGGGGSDDVS